MPRLLLTGVVSLLVLILASACSTIGTGQAAEPPIPEKAAPLVKLAKDDLAAYKSIPASKIRFVSATETQFNDSSLGCPEPGMSYLQVITPGWSIKLAIGGDSYFYGAANGSVTRCDHPPAVIEGQPAQPPLPGGTTLR